jgi:hypothetical protein
MLVNSVIFQTLFQVILLLAFATRHPSLSALFFLLSLVLIISSYKVLGQFSLIVKIVGVAFIGVTGVMFTLNMFRYLPAMVFWVLGIVTFLCTSLLLRNKYFFQKASGWTLFFLQGVTLFSFVYFGFENFPWVNPIEKIIPGGSANGITSFVVILQINYSLCKFVRGEKAPILPLIVTLIIAIGGYGRGSTICAILLILLTAGIQVFTKNRWKMITVVCLVVLGGTVYYIKNKSNIDYFLVQNTKFSSAGTKSSHREYMMKDYKKKINWGTFFQGAGYENTAITTYYHNNPHNSYIRAHNIFGLPYLIIIFVMPFVAYLFYRSKIHAVFGFGLFLILTIRCLSEPNLFPGIMDFYYFALILFPASIIQKSGASEQSGGVK